MKQVVTDKKLMPYHAVFVVVICDDGFLSTNFEIVKLHKQYWTHATTGEQKSVTQDLRWETDSQTLLRLPFIVHHLILVTSLNIQN